MLQITNGVQRDVLYTNIFENYELLFFGSKQPEINIFSGLNLPKVYTFSDLKWWEYHIFSELGIFWIFFFTPTFLDVHLVIILNHYENHEETDLKLSRYFKQVLSTTKITNGLKDNLKSLELFEAINEIYINYPTKMTGGTIWKE